MKDQPTLTAYDVTRARTLALRPEVQYENFRYACALCGASNGAQDTFVVFLTNQPGPARQRYVCANRDACPHQH
jgi:alpha-D-ribose 1-methylphosphonate 5-phosphate C-P lyase